MVWTGANVLAVAVISTVALLGIGWLLLDYWDSCNDRRSVVTHHLPERSGGMPESCTAVSVAELLENAVREGNGVRLHWTTEDTDPHGFARWRDDDWPTEVLPVIRDYR